MVFQHTQNAFFFSSRRRHTRCGRDWSSDVCSSDLRLLPRPLQWRQLRAMLDPDASGHGLDLRLGRSEERRVGKECRSWWARYHKKKKQAEIVPHGLHAYEERVGVS